MACMRRTLSFLSLLLLLALAPQSHAEGPAIVIDNPEYNFGQIFAGTKVTHVFTFKNAGTAPLVIEKVRHSCGCTASLLSSETLQPGESAEVKSTFNSARFNGPQVKTIYLYSNDPAHAVTQLHMRGVVAKEISQHPSRVSLTNLVPKVTVTREVVLVNHGQNQILFQDPQVSSPELAVSLSERSLAPDQNLTVTILITPKEDNRRVSGYVILPLSGAFVDEIQIPVYGELVRPDKP